MISTEYDSQYASLKMCYRQCFCHGDWFCI